MAYEFHVDDKLLVRGRSLPLWEAIKEGNKRRDLVGNFHNYWEIFTWNSKNRFKLFNKGEEYGKSRIEVSVSDISAGNISEDFSSVNLQYPINSIRIHSYGVEDGPILPISQKSMMIIVKKLEREKIPCLLHHHPTKDFVGWNKSVDYVSEILRERIGSRYVSSGFSKVDDWLDLGEYEFPIEL